MSIISVVFLIFFIFAFIVMTHGIVKSIILTRRIEIEMAKLHAGMMGNFEIPEKISEKELKDGIAFYKEK